MTEQVHSAFGLILQRRGLASPWEKAAQGRSCKEASSASCPLLSCTASIRPPLMQRTRQNLSFKRPPLSRSRSRSRLLLLPPFALHPPPCGENLSFKRPPPSRSRSRSRLLPLPHRCGELGEHLLISLPRYVGEGQAPQVPQNLVPRGEGERQGVGGLERVAGSMEKAGRGGRGEGGTCPSSLPAWRLCAPLPSYHASTTFMAAAVSPSAAFERSSRTWRVEEGNGGGGGSSFVPG